MDLITYAILKKKLDTKADLIDGKIPAEQLPSYVDDVVEYADKDHFPATGERSKIYVALDTGYIYRWSGSEYIQIGGQDITADDIDSGSVPQGKVLTADGEGGATWEEGGISEITPADIDSSGSVIGGTLLVADSSTQKSKWTDFYMNFNAIPTFYNSTTNDHIVIKKISVDNLDQDYDNGQIECDTNLSYTDFTDILLDAMNNLGTWQNIYSYDAVDTSRGGVADIVAIALSSIYSYKIIELYFTSGGLANLEFDNKDIEFTTLNGVLTPYKFVGKLHIVEFDVNVDLLFKLEFDEATTSISLQVKAVPHVEENQFLAPEYDTTVSYVAGDLCLHLGVLYVCTANTSGTFDDSDWQPTTIAGSVLGLLNTGV